MGKQIGPLAIVKCSGNGKHARGLSVNVGSKAVESSYVANTPCHSALLTSGRRLVGLAFNACDLLSAHAHDLM